MIIINNCEINCFQKWKFIFRLCTYLLLFSTFQAVALRTSPISFLNKYSLNCLFPLNLMDISISSRSISYVFCFRFWYPSYATINENLTISNFWFTFRFALSEIWTNISFSSLHIFRCYFAQQNDSFVLHYKVIKKAEFCFLNSSEGKYFLQGALCALLSST